MNITTVLLPSTSVPQTGAQQWSITTPVGDPPQRFFRRELLLRFANPEGTETLVIDPTATKLQVSFQPLEYDTLAKTHEFPAGSKRFVDSNTTVIIEMDAPREVVSVDFSLSPGALIGKTLELYRIDGEALADKPTSSRVLGQFKILTVDIQPSGKNVGAKTFALQPPTAIEQAIFTQFSETPFIDARFAFRLRQAGGGYEALDSAQISAVKVRSYPTGQRVGVITPGPESEARYFARPEATSSFEAGALLAEELNRILERLPSPLPANFQLALVLESDAPCLATISQFSIAYTLRQHSFPSGEDKQVLRFAGEELTSHNLPLAFPSNVTVVAATLEIAESFGPGRPLGVGAANASIAEATGVRVGPASWAAQKIILSAAISVEGLALALLGVEPKTELIVQLREDWQNGPAGAIVAEGNIALAQPGERRWRTVRFSQPQTLNTTGYWILAQAASGGAVWLATPGEHPVRVFSGDRTAVEELSVLDGLQVLTYFFSPQVALLGQSPVRLSVGGQIVNSTTSNSDRRQFDIRAALNAVPPDAASPTRTTQLIFLSDLQGSVTVYPPRIEYEVE